MARKSKQKQAVLRVLNRTTSHPTAKWIYEEVRQEIPDISLGTVYRNLKLLKCEGKILELDFTTLVGSMAISITTIILGVSDAVVCLMWTSRWTS